MITHNEYLNAKEIVDEYEQQEYIKNLNDSLYCSCCDAINEQDCICSFINDCNLCGGINGDHDLSCPDNESPYAMLLRDGYD